MFDNINAIGMPAFLSLSRSEQKAALEALIFSSDEPLTMSVLVKLLAIGAKPNDAKDNENDATIENEIQPSLEAELNSKFDVSKEFFDGLVADINKELLETGRPFFIVDFAGGFSYSVRPEWGALTAQLVKSKTKRRLSQASLETLAIIAYKQPVTKPEIEQIRGVNSGDIVNSLIEKQLVRIAGRRDTLGKPLLYATSIDFLKMFGLTSLEELPKLRELEELGIYNETAYKNETE